MLEIKGKKNQAFNFMAPFLQKTSCFVHLQFLRTELKVGARHRDVIGGGRTSGFIYYFILVDGRE